MANHKLNKTFLDRMPLPPKKADGKAGQALYWDTQLPRFGVRVGSGGTKTFLVEKRVNGRTKRMTIGRYGELTVEQARKEAMKLLGEVAKGNDPIAQRKAKAAKGVTLEQAFQAYLQSRKDLKKGTVNNYTKCINGCFADWKSKRLVDISKDMVQARHRELGSRAPQRANNAMRVLRAIFNHSMHAYEDAKGRPYITVNPVSRLSQAREWYPTVRRQTVLKVHDVKAWYDATGELENDAARDLLRLVLFTGLRKMEAATLRWSDIDLKAKTLTVPDTKNRTPHTLPLTDYLYELLETRANQAQCDWVFPSTLTDGHIKEPRGSISQVIEKSGVHFTLHDLRRTFITVAESLDISAYSLKRLANHRMANDITASYIITDVERLRSPMERITQFLLEQIRN